MYSGARRACAEHLRVKDRGSRHQCRDAASRVLTAFWADFRQIFVLRSRLVRVWWPIATDTTCPSFSRDIPEMCCCAYCLSRLRNRRLRPVSLSWARTRKVDKSRALRTWVDHTQTRALQGTGRWTSHVSGISVLHGCIA